MNGNTVHRGGSILKHHPVATYLPQDNRIHHRPLRERISQRPNGRRDFSDELNRWTVVSIEVRTHDIDMDESPISAAIPKGGFIFDRVVPDSDHNIGRVEKPVRRLSMEEADTAAEQIEIFPWYDSSA